MQQIIEWPRITETNVDNNDDEETVPWSPHPNMINEGTTSGNDTETTLPWIDVIPRLDSHKSNSLDERSQNESGRWRKPNSQTSISKQLM